MQPLPAPETIFGSQELTQEDQEAHGSRFRDVKAAIFANPYQPVWGAPNAPPLPYYKTTNTSVYAGSFPAASPPIQTGLDTSVGFPGGFPVGRRWQRLSQTGAPQRRLRHRRLGHHRRQPLFRRFQQDSQGLAIARISAGVTTMLPGRRRSYGSPELIPRWTTTSIRCTRPTCHSWMTQEGQPVRISPNSSPPTRPGPVSFVATKFRTDQRGRDLCPRGPHGHDPSGYHCGIGGSRACTSPCPGLLRPSYRWTAGDRRTRGAMKSGPSL